MTYRDTDFQALRASGDDVPPGPFDLDACLACGTPGDLGPVGVCADCVVLADLDGLRDRAGELVAAIRRHRDGTGTAYHYDAFTRLRTVNLELWSVLDDAEQHGIPTEPSTAGRYDAWIRAGVAAGFCTPAGCLVHEPAELVANAEASFPAGYDWADPECVPAVVLMPPVGDDTLEAGETTPGLVRPAMMEDTE